MFLKLSVFVDFLYELIRSTKVNLFWFKNALIIMFKI